MLLKADRIVARRPRPLPGQRAPEGGRLFLIVPSQSPARNPPPPGNGWIQRPGVAWNTLTILMERLTLNLGEVTNPKIKRRSRRMKFVKESRIAAPPRSVFAFHESPGALARLTPPWENVSVVEGGDSIEVGSRVVLQTKLGPVRLKWVAEHTEYDPPHLFADRQVSGPFASWYHRHRILDDGHGGSILRDEVDFEPPLGSLGRLLAGGYLRSKLQKMFDYRHRTTKSIVEEGDFSSKTP